MNQIGNKCIDIIWDAERLQCLWAQENGLNIDLNKWNSENMISILIAQLRAFRPSVIFIQGSNVFSKNLLDHLKSEISSIKLDKFRKVIFKEHF